MRIILIGKAGSGKDHMRDFLNLVEPIDVSYTTRPKRVGEKESYTYNYISQEEFLKMKSNNQFLEAVNFNGWYYGTSIKNWNTKTVFIMTPSGVKNIPKKDLKDCILVYFDIPLEVRKKRLSKRSDFDTVDRRLNADELDFAGFTKFNIRITNPNFDCEQVYTTILTYAKCQNIQ